MINASSDELSHKGFVGASVVMEEARRMNDMYGVGAAERLCSRIFPKSNDELCDWGGKRYQSDRTD